MAVTTEKSTQVTKLDATPRTLLDNLDLGGNLRLARFTFTQGVAEGDATSTATLFEAQTGERLIGHLSKIYWSTLGAGHTLDVGYAAHVNVRTGETVTADPDFFVDGVDASSAGSCAFDQSDTSGVKDGFFFEGKALVLATATGGTASLPAGCTIKGFAALAGTP